MMRSLFSAVSGLKTHQTRMDVIGNNIANVNTEAFKASSVRFSELMYQTLSTASGGDGALGTGGVNAKQIGLGVNTASTTINITGAGSSETTGTEIAESEIASGIVKRVAPSSRSAPSPSRASTI